MMPGKPKSRTGVPNLFDSTDRQQQWLQLWWGMFLHTQPKSHTCANEVLRAHPSLRQGLGNPGLEQIEIWK